MQYAIELSSSKAAILQQKARQKGIKVEELLQSLINKLLSDDFILDGREELLQHKSAQNVDDPIEKFIGIAYSENPDWIEKHDHFSRCQVDLTG